MAIAKIKKLKMVGLIEEKDNLLDALHRTGAVQIKQCVIDNEGVTDASRLSKKAEIEEQNAFLIKQLDFLQNSIEKYVSDNKLPKAGELTDGFIVEYKKFNEIAERKEELFSAAREIDELSKTLVESNNKINRLNLTKNNLLPFKCVSRPFCDFHGTENTRIELGLVTHEKLGLLNKLFSEKELSYFYAFTESENENVPTVIVSHKSESEELFNSLSEYGYSKTQYNYDRSASDVIAELNGETEELEKTVARTEKKIYNFLASVKDLKLLSDYLGYQIEKQAALDEFAATKSTFMMEAYVPEKAEKKIDSALKSVSAAVYTEYNDVDNDEMPPTLLENKKIIHSFEFVTNMYSAPNYREFDPNPVMSIFFSIFMGFIMADIGYGLLMASVGLFMGLRSKKENGTKNLFLVIGYGGIMAIIFGILFGSFFGISHEQWSLIPKAIMPDPQKDLWTISGIKIQELLIICFGMGIVQIIVGQICNAYQKMRRGKILDGILDGVVWACFLVGLIMFAMGMIDELNMPFLVKPGAIIAVTFVIIGALFAGRHEKGFGKVTKSFGAVYGLVNYLSDILSYARLYGLMLSGAIVASIVSELAIGMMTSPIKVVFGVLILVIGHLFNLAISVLGAYIHDARLQYMEFFSRFYEGDGELFRPLGSDMKYIYLVG